MKDPPAQPPYELIQESRAVELHRAMLDAIEQSLRNDGWRTVRLTSARLDAVFGDDSPTVHDPNDHARKFIISCWPTYENKDILRSGVCVSMNIVASDDHSDLRADLNDVNAALPLEYRYKTLNETLHGGFAYPDSEVISILHVGNGVPKDGKPDFSEFAKYIAGLLLAASL